MQKENDSLITFPAKQSEEFVEKGSEFQTTYFEFVFELPIVVPLEEVSDEELLKLVESSGEFSYLNTTEEDIYTLSDGTPL